MSQSNPKNVSSVATTSISTPALFASVPTKRNATQVTAAEKDEWWAYQEMITPLKMRKMGDGTLQLKTTKLIFTRTRLNGVGKMDIEQSKDPIQNLHNMFTQGCITILDDTALFELLARVAYNRVNKIADPKSKHLSLLYRSLSWTPHSTFMITDGVTVGERWADEVLLCRR